MPLATIKKGFTLIELAMVLVIIGLFTGGILVGKDLIHAAEIRSQIKQFQEYGIAYNTFKIKYNCTVGDCQSATSIFGSTDSTGTAITNGNGNGRIDTYHFVAFGTAGEIWGSSFEMFGVFQELSIANLIPLNLTASATWQIGIYPPTLILNQSSRFFFSADYGFNDTTRNPNTSQYRRGTNAIWATRCKESNTMQQWDDNCGIFLASDLQRIDEKLDDGKPLSGKLFGFGGYSTNNNCLSGIGVNAVYDNSYATPQCQAAYVVE